jgi:phosphonate transport system ATP-binding protein
MLEVKNLTKIYDDGTVALRNVNFTVAEGEFLVIIGLSGSGKSTLLRCINRLIEPTEGQIIWNGKDITVAESTQLRETRRQIGMIFQHFNLVKRSTVLTNVLSGRLGYVNPWFSLVSRFPPEDMEMAMQALEQLGITDQASGRTERRTTAARGGRPRTDAGAAHDPG